MVAVKIVFGSYRYQSKACMNLRSGYS